MNSREKIARRAALELNDGNVVNLGHGIPVGVANYVPDDVEVILQTENGALNMGPTPKWGEQCSDDGNASGLPITLKPGAAIFDVGVSFGIIRGSHVDVSILGSLEVDQEGSLANWTMPGFSPGMGGAMDLVACARKIVVVMNHNNKDGTSKFLKKCTLPLTGHGVVNRLVTDKAVFEFGPDGPVLIEKDPGLTVEELRGETDAVFIVSPYLCDYRMSAKNL